MIEVLLMFGAVFALVGYIAGRIAGVLWVRKQPLWYAIQPDNELVGVFTSKDALEDAIRESCADWIGWGPMEPTAARLNVNRLR